MHTYYIALMAIIMSSVHTQTTKSFKESFNDVLVPFKIKYFIMCVKRYPS